MTAEQDAAGGDGAPGNTGGAAVSTAADAVGGTPGLGEASDGAAGDETEGDSFRDFGLSQPVLRALDELGYEAPTPVQRETISVLLEGRDVIAQAQTGTGKTAAYGIPIVERVAVGLRRPQALVLAPTRELAVQVAEAVHQLGKFRGVLVLPVYGGQPMDRQLRGLRAGVHVVVGTPGRILDHLRRRTLDLSEIQQVVLDEADEMLDMGFLEDVESILAAVAEAGGERDEADGEDASDVEGAVALLEGAPVEGAPPQGEGQRRTQSAMFSATMPAPVQRLSRRFLHDPVRVAITPEQVTVPQIEQVAYEIGGADKLDALARVLDVEAPGAAIVFCGTRRTTDDIADRLAVRGFRAAALHGDMAQAERERVLRRFRDGQTEVLVATDVAARGLDIEGVTHVVNFDVPWDPGSYVHRIGRTGRAGRAGAAITLVTPRDYRMLSMIERLLGSRITRKRLPSLGDLATRRREAAKEAVAAAIGAGDLDPYLVLAGELGDQFDPVEVAAAALRLWDQERNAANDGTTLAGVLKAAEAEQQARQAEQEAQQAARAARARRRDATEFEADGQAPETGMRRILVAAGRVDRLRPQDLVGAIANEAGIPGRAVGAIDIYDRFSYVEVPRQHATRVVQALTRTTLRGRRVGARLADGEASEAPRPPASRPAGPPPSRPPLSGPPPPFLSPQGPVQAPAGRGGRPSAASTDQLPLDEDATGRPANDAPSPATPPPATPRPAAPDPTNRDALDDDRGSRRPRLPTRLRHRMGPLRRHRSHEG